MLAPRQANRARKVLCRLRGGHRGESSARLAPEAVARRGRGGRAWTLERVFEMFPRLEERRKQGAGFLSGGEQQMPRKEYEIMMYTCTPAGLSPRRTPPARKGARNSASARSASTLTVRDRKGRGLRVDLHCHYFHPDVHAKVAHLDPAQHEPSVQFANALTRETNVKQMRERAEALSSIERRLKDMDRMGIDIQAVSPAPNQTDYWTDAGMGAELARAVNDRLAGIVGKWPDRFVALGTIPLQNVELAVQELERAVKQLGLRGVEINPSVNGLDLGDPRLDLDRFFAKAQELDAVIFMHPIGFTQGERLSNHYFNNVIGNPLETTVAASHLIFDGVMDRHPRLKIVLPHAGGYLAHYWARMDHAHAARPDCRTVIRKAPTSYLKKFYFDTITFDPDMLRHLISKWGADHVVLGTDYPYDMGEVDPIGLIARVPRLSAAEKEAIMGGNAARLLKIRARAR
jgi:aminocarboxymuconate-semialdehyde decarboxylase